MSTSARAGPLFALLRRALGAAAAGGALSGCCQERTQPGVRYKVVAFAPSAQKPSLSTSGWLDAETCSAACGIGITECRLTTFSVPARVPRAACKQIPSGHTEELDNVGPLPADFDAGSRVSGAALDLSICTEACGPGTTHCTLWAPKLGPDDQFMLCRVSWEGGQCVGLRVPAGRVPLAARPRAASSVAEYLAGCAELEAASIRCFELIARELTSFGAPATLRRRARRARIDEARHARILSRLARALGARPRRQRLQDAAPRSLAVFLRENAREGCAGETMGALLALHQASHAKDPAIRDAMARIARDEARHAALAWAIHERLLPELSVDDRLMVMGHLRASFDAYDAGLDVPPHIAREVGLPTRARLRTMLESLRETLPDRDTPGPRHSRTESCGS